MSDSAVVKSFTYKPKNFMMLMAILLFGPIAWIAMHEAQTNDQGVILTVSKIELISLNPSEATVFYWILCAAAFCFSIGGLFALYKAFTSKATIDLTEEEIILPKGLFSVDKPITIPFIDIICMDLQSINGIRFLTIIHTNGKVSVGDDMLPKKSQLNEIIELIENKIKDKH
jgi:hypothetical protein